MGVPRNYRVRPKPSGTWWQRRDPGTQVFLIVVALALVLSAFGLMLVLLVLAIH